MKTIHALLPAVLAATAAAVCACGGPAAAPATTAAPGPAPQAWQRIGGPASRISVDVPAAWRTADFALQTVPQAYAQLKLPVSMSEFRQNPGFLAQFGGLVAIDGQAVRQVQGAFIAPNINASCQASGTNLQGAAGIPVLRQDLAGISRFGKITSEAPVTLDRVPGLLVRYTVTLRGGITEQAAGLAALPESSDLCTVYITYPGPQMPGSLVSQAVSTVTFPG